MGIFVKHEKKFSAQGMYNNRTGHTQARNMKPPEN